MRSLELGPRGDEVRQSDDIHLYIAETLEKAVAVGAAYDLPVRSRRANNYAAPEGDESVLDERSEKM
jgi:hypothetical protein